MSEMDIVSVLEYPSIISSNDECFASDGMKFGWPNPVISGGRLVSSEYTKFYREFLHEAGYEECWAEDPNGRLCVSIRDEKMGVSLVVGGLERGVIESKNREKRRVRAFLGKAGQIHRVISEAANRELVVKCLNHGIPNANSTISAAAEIIGKYVDREKVTENVKRVKKGTYQIKSLMAARKILDRSWTPTYDNVRPHPIHQVIEMNRRVLRPDFQEKRMSVELSECYLKVSMPADILGAIVFNILDNALKHGRPDSEVEVGFERISNRALRVCFRMVSRRIESDEVTKITEPGYRGNAAIDTTEGMGLGLSIVKRAVRSFGGELIIDAGEEGNDFCENSFCLHFPEHLVGNG